LRVARRKPVTRRTLIALFTWKRLPQHAAATLCRGSPRPIDPRRIVPDMLVVPTFKFSNPVLLIILMEVDDPFIHSILGA
jgi:hypothetical protein